MSGCGRKEGIPERKEVKGMIKRLLFVSFMAVGLMLLYSSPSHAVHKGAGDLTCGNCHTMHNSQGNTALEGDPSLVLLRASVSSRAEIHNLCLQCHGSNGAQNTVDFDGNGNAAPKVYINGAAGKGNNTTGFDFFKIGAGGDFSAELTWNGTGNATDTASTGYGHSLGITSAKPPGNKSVPGAQLTSTNGYFTCTNCHDPHGTVSTTSTVNKFRNLRTQPTGAGATGAVQLHDNTVGYKAGIAGDLSGSNSSSGATLIWAVAESSIQGSATADTGNTNVYAYSSSSDMISNWCARCHNQWHETIQTANKSGDDWLRHPVDNVLVDGTPNSGGGVAIVDLSNYTTTLIQGGTALPVASLNTATNPVYYYTDSGNDKVFCLSCHFAHAGPYLDGLRWDYLASVGSGSQQGNPVPSDTGCQQCHNR